MRRIHFLLTTDLADLIFNSTSLLRDQHEEVALSTMHKQQRLRTSSLRRLLKHLIGRIGRVLPSIHSKAQGGSSLLRLQRHFSSIRVQPSRAIHLVSSTNFDRETIWAVIRQTRAAASP